MENETIWGTMKNTYQEKEWNNQTDILIIGSGITGITTAYFLKDSKYQITLIDKSYLGMGVTSKTTAKLNYLQGITYQNLKNTVNEKTSKSYFNSQKEAINLVCNIIKKEAINCDLEKCQSYIFTKEKAGIKKIEKEKALLEKWHVTCQNETRLPIHFPIEFGISVKDTYTFHPLKYLNGLVNKIKSNINIFENTTAQEIKKRPNGTYITKTNRGEITSKYVVVACHYPFFINPTYVPFKTYIEREYVNASPYNYNKNFTAVSIDKNFHSLRFYNNYIIYGSNKHRLTNKIKYADNYEKSIRDFKAYFSKQPEYTWMNQDIITNDSLPLIGVANKSQPNLLIATGFQAWGMTNGTIAAKIISDIILKKDNCYIKLFDPTRINANGILNSLIDGLYYSKIYLQTTIKKNPISNCDSVYVIKINNKYYGIYIDYYGKKHIVKQKCPHMKCNLIFNNYEKTWDCPCHGSRFDIEGNVLEGPTTYSIATNFNNNDI